METQVCEAVTSQQTGDGGSKIKKAAGILGPTGKFQEPPMALGIQGSLDKLHLNYFIWLMIVIYNFIATSVLGVPLEKVYGFITYGFIHVLSIDYKRSQATIYWYFLSWPVFLLRNVS